jgi:hypothetical protein
VERVQGGPDLLAVRGALQCGNIPKPEFSQVLIQVPNYSGKFSDSAKLRYLGKTSSGPFHRATTRFLFT